MAILHTNNWWLIKLLCIVNYFIFISERTVYKLIEIMQL